MRQTGERVPELVIALPRGGSVTVQFNPYLVTEQPAIRCVLCVNGTMVRLVELRPPLTLNLTLTLKTLF